MKLNKGIYEHLITEQLQRSIDLTTAQGMSCLKEKVDEAEAPSLLAEYIGQLIKRRLAESDSADDRASLANRLIEMLSSDDDKIADEKQLLAEVISAEESATRRVSKQAAVRPLSGFRVSNLFTGGQSALSLSGEIERDIASADRISLIVSFLKLSGVNLIYDKLRDFCNVEGHQLRIITTTYCGVTEAKAVQRLAELPNTQIRISYHTEIERLHAKSYIFERNTSLSTAYIGSSNLSKSAQTDGLEWNIRVTNVENPHIIKTALATFDRYWNSPNFEAYNPNGSGLARFNEQMEKDRARHTPAGALAAGALCQYSILPHQKQILDKLLLERDHGLTRNLVVAATGTGKTVISAFDYKAFCDTLQRRGRLLFVAHRKEILQQAHATYRSVMQDANFGDIWVGDLRPQRFDQLFVSVQTLRSQFSEVFATMAPDRYDYIVIDEAHHSTADSYRCILDHFRPKILMGLTATPERMDGMSLLPDFGGKISAEIRLSKALNEGLLTPFHYFCISDPDTDLSDPSLMQGKRYVTSQLFDRLCTRQRVSLVVRSLDYYLSDPHRCKALCFCSDKRHAAFMADALNAVGLRAASLTSDNQGERTALNRQLAQGRINYLCVVDIFNEGVDIPEVDTVLFLRPTDSLTIFLQQLGRGLRLAPGKQALTVLDFVAQLNRNYDYAGRFRSLMLRPEKNLKEQITNGFTVLPMGCSIHLEEKARRMVLDNITSAIYDRRRLITELQSYPYTPTLANFVDQIGQDVRILYRNNSCWTSLKRDAGKCSYVDDANTRMLAKGLASLTHVNSADYLRFILDVMSRRGDISAISPDQEPYSVMLYYSLFQNSIQKLGFTSIAQALAQLKDYPLFVDEITQLAQYQLDHIQVRTFDIGGDMPAHLEQYGCYSRNEILALFGYQTATCNMQSFGVFDAKRYNVELLFVTLNKSEADFSPSTQYDDYVINDRMFHWQSPNSEDHAGKGARYVNQASNGKRFLLFVRDEKRDGFGLTAAFFCFGFVDYVRSYGDKPMSIEWQLRQPILPQFIKAV
jgi:superfamily II DNA or RNA helicase/HKD family nuclease